MPTKQMRIPGGLNPGKKIRIQGRTQPGAKNFIINLKCNETSQAHIALHFSVRLNENVVVRNTWRDKWESEERNQPIFPFKQGQDFNIVIQVLHDRYDVSVNNNPFISFNHRLQYDWVQFLSLEGDASFYHISFDDSGQSAFAPMVVNTMSAPYTAQSAFAPQPVVVNTMSAPYTASREQVRINGALYPGKQIVLRGTVNHGAQRMAINLKCNDTENGHIALHFNPRFNEGRVVLNSWRDKWEQELSGPPTFPFFPGADFDITITVNPDRYHISVNGSHYTDFYHRLQYDLVQVVAMEGDAHFTYISV